ncbi:MAG: TldD/PmbA family protein, partial [Clostridiales bacterium]|nr:TldD/PmbA family protein [Clostridiales bacterium]
MKVAISKYLTEQKDNIKQLVDLLSRDFEHVSVLGTDVKSKTYFVNKTGAGISDSSWAERGFVARLHNGYNYSEYSFNRLSGDGVQRLYDVIKASVSDDLRVIKETNMLISKYPLMGENSIKESYFKEIKIPLESVNPEEKIRKLTEIKDKALTYSDLLVDLHVNYDECHISKIFISTNRELEQSYVWTSGSIFAIAMKEERTKYYYDVVSGLKGVEILDELKAIAKGVVESAEKLLDAKKMEGGVYDVICSPDIAGLIAHEAFGHGVEMDMFLKNRAKAVEFIGKKVASEYVNMHDGAASANHMATYLFDDEGTIGTDTLIIDRGILKSGISDLLSAQKLGTQPTGNGRRESFERKAYARMTNTFFARGNHKLVDMIASVKSGFLLEGVLSGMEDPKNWGIQ